MTTKEAWELLQEHIPEAAGYEPCEYDEMADYIAEFEEAYRIVDEAIRNG
jgi:hypothetical protein